MSLSLFNIDNLKKKSTGNYTKLIRLIFLEYNLNPYCSQANWWIENINDDNINQLNELIINLESGSIIDYNDNILFKNFYTTKYLQKFNVNNLGTYFIDYLKVEENINFNKKFITNLLNIQPNPTINGNLFNYFSKPFGSSMFVTYIPENTTVNIFGKFDKLTNSIYYSLIVIYDNLMNLVFVKSKFNTPFINTEFSTKNETCLLCQIFIRDISFNSTKYTIPDKYLFKITNLNQEIETIESTKEIRNPISRSLNTPFEKLNKTIFKNINLKTNCRFQKIENSQLGLFSSPVDFYFGIMYDTSYIGVKISGKIIPENNMFPFFCFIGIDYESTTTFFTLSYKELNINNDTDWGSIYEIYILNNGYSINNKKVINWSEELSLKEYKAIYMIISDFSNLAGSKKGLRRMKSGFQSQNYCQDYFNNLYGSKETFPNVEYLKSL